MKQVERSASGIFLIENEPDKEIRESPGGYFFEKSRKSELIRLKQKEEIQEARKVSWVSKILSWWRNED